MSSQHLESWSIQFPNIWNFPSTSEWPLNEMELNFKRYKNIFITKKLMMQQKIFDVSRIMYHRNKPGNCTLWINSFSFIGKPEYKSLYLNSWYLMAICFGRRGGFVWSWYPPMILFVIFWCFLHHSQYGNLLRQ